MRRHLDLELPHLWVVYPRSRDENQLHLQMVGVWEPSTLAAADALVEGEEPASQGAAIPSDALAEGDDYFSVRGELIYTRPETGDLVVKVRQLPRADGSRPIPFKLQLRGEVPLDHLRHFVALDLRRQGQHLCLESCEVVAPLAQRGTRGGKGRRGGGGTGGGAGGERGERGERRGSDRRPAEADKGRGVGPARNHGQAVSRPSR